MPTSVRLDRNTEKLLEKLARTRSQSKSDVIRDAVESLAIQEKSVLEEASLLDSISDLIGCVDGGPVDLSEQTGKKLRVLLSNRSTDG